MYAWNLLWTFMEFDVIIYYVMYDDDDDDEMIMHIKDMI